ncbi:MAG: caspase domain-containing protein, partial [Caulobacterales bacterium]|nr:caspase domain-containing protein [Caulobacterales bacterium]
MAKGFFKAALVGLGLATASQAPGAASEGRRVALVIGNSAYVNAAPLPNPVNDARDMAAALVELGFEVVEGYDLNRPDMSQTIRDFSQRLAGADVGLFFYAGHGLQVNGKNYMAPVDAALEGEESLDFEAVDMGLVLAQMERDPRVNLIILDACRDNPLADALARSMGPSRSMGVARGLAQLDTVAVGTLIAYSTQPGATAADGTGRNSPFTGAMLARIRTPGLEVQQMMRRVRADVIDGSDGRQVPWDNSSLTTDFYFVPPPEGSQDGPALAPTEPSERQIEVRFWFDVKDTGSIDELQSYLDKYPNGEFAGAAEARIKGLTIAAEAPGGDPGSVEAQFAKLAARDIIIPEPKDAHEFYNNARYYELRSDALNAGRMYARFLSFGLPKVDPHYAYQDYLKAQEGRAGAREAYNELVYDNPDDEVLRFAAALLQAPETRKRQLEAYVAAHPDFAPARYELSNEFSQRRLGAQTIGDKRAEQEQLTAFLSLAEAGGLYTYFMDQRLARRQIEDAEQRLALLDSAVMPVLEQPVNITAMSSNDGWTISVYASEQAKEYFIALPGEDFESLGTMSQINPMTGEPMARP